MVVGVTAKFAALALEPSEVPPEETEYQFILLPVDVAFKFEEDPRQIDAALADTEEGAEGTRDTVTVKKTELEQPLPLVTV